GLLELTGDDQLLEPTRADDVRALAHEERAVVVGRVDDLDAAHGLGLPGRRHARRAAGDQRPEGTGVGWRGAAAAADDVDPSLVPEAPHLEREARGRLGVLAALVRQPRVRVDADEAGGH